MPSAPLAMKTSKMAPRPVKMVSAEKGTRAMTTIQPPKATARPAQFVRRPGLWVSVENDASQRHEEGGPDRLFRHSALMVAMMILA